MPDEAVSWFRKDWMATDANALGVYVTLLILRFRVRYRTDVPMLRSDEFLFGARLKPILTLFLKDNEDEEEQQQKELLLKDALTAGKEFLNVLSKNTSFSDFEEALDDIERYFYDTFKDVYLRHVNRAAMKGTIADHDASALIKRFLNDVAANRFPKGKITSAGSCILLTPFGDLIEFYGLTQDEANRFLAILRQSGIMFMDIVPAPVLEDEFRESLV